MRLPALRRRLVTWYRSHRRDMPWRRTRDPYRIWLAEVMLQQTRVAAVVPYYERFVRRFPTVQKLARARTEEVLRLWAGLGYYSRARNLHRAAKEMVARHRGQFPRQYEDALALPGIGRYTAAAVLSMAYGAPLAVLDGNVARVLARLGAIRGDLRAPRRWKQLEDEAQRLLPPKAGTPGDWNQAMMELGATVCTPRLPQCRECPVAKWCRARQLGIAEQVPSVRKKRAPVKVQIAAAVLLDPRNRTLLVRRNGGLFSGMWQFPAVEVQRNARTELQTHLQGLLQKKKSISQRARKTQSTQSRDGMEALPRLSHAVTFRELTLWPYLIRVPRLPDMRGARAIGQEQIAQVPISSATRKVAEAAGLLRAGR